MAMERKNVAERNQTEEEENETNGTTTGTTSGTGPSNHSTTTRKTSN